PECLDGARAGPPEDCGGPPGYQDLLDALANPRHPRHRELRRWVGKSWDAERFDLEAVNRALRSRSPRK
ncbi:MAG: plasmid pRiA4b ORF-3 family protein, partial [Gammaproteobacteria bacterium]